MARDAHELNLSDTLVSSLFIEKYMFSLSSAAIKFYLYALMRRQSLPRLPLQALADELDIDHEQVQAILRELEARDLIAARRQGRLDDFELLDIKSLEVERHIQKKEYQLLRKPKIEHELESDDDLLEDINNSFFHGGMSYFWFQLLDELRTKYPFDDACIYALFSEAYRRQSLNVKWIRTCASDWDEHGVHSYDAVETYLQKRQQRFDLIQKLAQRLRLHLTEKHERIFQHWIDDYDLDEDLMDLLLSQTLHLNHPNFNYYERVLARWHEAGIRSAADLEREKEARQEVRGTDRGTQNKQHLHSRTAQKSRRPQLRERRYSDADFQRMMQNQRPQGNDQGEGKTDD
ncbi:MAG: DnaD domain protein [Eubacteriales bacterium]|nr:DnaD domain protein [Eubacteriales bacterium]